MLLIEIKLSVVKLYKSSSDRFNCSNSLHIGYKTSFNQIILNGINK